MGPVSYYSPWIICSEHLKVTCFPRRNKSTWSHSFVSHSFYEPQDDAKRRSASLDETPRGSWASSIFDLKNSTPDALLPSVLERTALEDMDQRNTEARQQGRHSDLLGLYPPPDEVCQKHFVILAGFIISAQHRVLKLLSTNLTMQTIKISNWNISAIDVWFWLSGNFVLSSVHKSTFMQL